MRDLRVGVIGYGAIGRAIVTYLVAHGMRDQIAGILVRPGQTPGEDLPFCDSLDALLQTQPTVVIESAGHQALAAFGPDILRSGADLAISSVGALADQRTIDALRTASAAGGRAMFPAGAIAGLDGLIAARIAGLKNVTYTSQKPAAAWRGTPAEQNIDLDHSEDEVCFFEGSARDAAAQYPKNANVSAAIALAGLGFDKTQVRLISSRRQTEPLGIIEASGDFGWFHFQIFANAFPENPKSSMLTAYSLLQCAQLGIGIPLD